MSVTIANATIRIGATADEVGKGVDAAIGHISRLAGMAAGIFGAIKVGGFMTEAVQKYEAAQLSFEVMLKSAERAKQLMADIVSYEKDTPIKFTEVANGIRRLLVARFDLEDVPSIFRIISDAAAASGDSVGQMMERITRSFGGMMSRGYITGEEVREMAHANISAYKYIAEELSRVERKTITTGEVQHRVHEKQISSATAVRAILAGMEKDFGGLGKRRGNETFEGLFSTMVSQAEVAGTKLILSIDKAFGIKASMRDFRDWLIDLPKKMEDIGESLRNNLGVQMLIKGFQTLAGVVSTTWEIATKGANEYAKALGLSGHELAMMEVNTYVLRGVIIDFAELVTRAFIRLADGINIAVVGSFKWIAERLATLGNVFAQNMPGVSDEVRKKHQANLDAIRASLKETMDPDGKRLEAQLDAAGKFFKGLRRAPWLQDAMLPVGLAIGDSLKEQVNDFNKGAHELKLDAKVDFTELNKDIDEFAKGLTSAIRDPFTKLKDELRGLEDSWIMGELSDAEYQAGVTGAMQRAQSAVKAGSNEPRVVDAISSSSAEARRMQIAAITGQTNQDTVPDLLKQIKVTSEKQLRTNEGLLDQARKSGIVIVP